MKTKLLSATVSCLMLFSFSGYAQQLPPNFAQMRQSPLMQQMMKNGMKTGIRSFWNGQGASLMAFGLMNDPDIRAAWGVSNEQFQEIQGIPMRLGAEVQNNPEFMKIMEEMQELGGPATLFGQNVDEATQQKLQDVQGRMTALSMTIMTDAIDKIITSEQKQKMNESLLANMAEMPIVSPSMFAALDLTDAQKQQMDEIKKELEPEFEKNLENFADGSMVLANAMFAEMEKQDIDFSSLMQGQGDMQDRIKAIQEKLLPIQETLMKNSEYKKISEEIQSKSKTFATKLNTKMFDILTDEQWNRLQKLIDNPPEYARVFGKKLKEQQAASEKAGGWQPGPHSWKPGDPIPEGYREQRNERRRFPRE